MICFPCLQFIYLLVQGACFGTLLTGHRGCSGAGWRVVPFGLSSDWVNWSPLLLCLRGLLSPRNFASRSSVAVTLAESFLSWLCPVYLQLLLIHLVSTPDFIYGRAYRFFIASHLIFPFKRFSCSDYLYTQTVTIRPIWKPHTKQFLPSHAFLTNTNLLFISFPSIFQIFLKDHVALCHLIPAIIS